MASCHVTPNYFEQINIVGLLLVFVAVLDLNLEVLISDALFIELLGCHLICFNLDFNHCGTR